MEISCSHWGIFLTGDRELWAWKMRHCGLTEDELAWCLTNGDVPVMDFSFRQGRLRMNDDLPSHVSVPTPRSAVASDVRDFEDYPYGHFVVHGD